MQSTPNLAVRAERIVDQAARSRLIEVLMRLGIGARGVVHLVIGALATRGLFGRPGAFAADSQEAIHVIGFIGVTPLVVLAFGLVGYAIWRIVQAVSDSDRKGRSVYGLLTRIGYAVSGLSYGVLAPFAIKLAIGLHVDDAPDPTRAWAYSVMSRPEGRWLVGIVGVIICYSAFAQAREAVRAVFREDYDETAGPVMRQILTATGRFGLFARSLVFAIMGYYLVRGALRIDPSEVRGAGASLAILREQPYGAWAFAITSVGLLSYALFSFLLARHRKLC
jgi:hypothetical protein